MSIRIAILALAACLAVGPCPARPKRRLRSREAWLRDVGWRREDPLRDARHGTARRDDPRLPRLLVLVAPLDSGAVGQFQVVAIDQRGYNLSDKPKGVESYAMSLLVADVAAVIRQLGRDKATIVGHDWGGAVAWQFALNLPEMTERLIVLNLPHPTGLFRELKSNPEQIANSEYARTFQRGLPRIPPSSSAGR